MTDLNDLLRQAHRDGLLVMLEEGRLALAGAQRHADLMARLRARKAEVVAALQRGRCACGAAADVWLARDRKPRCERCLWRLRTKYLTALLTGRASGPFWCRCGVCNQPDANHLTDDNRQLCGRCWWTATGRAFEREGVA